MHTKFFMAGGLALLGVLAFAVAGAQAEIVSDPGTYPLATCPVSGKALPESGETVSTQYQGREIRFCSSECRVAFEADPAKYAEKIDQQIAEQQRPHYPLAACVVSGEKLGTMGEPVDLVYKNRLVRFCCPACKEPFLKEPEKYLSQLDKAVVEKQKADYPLTKCPVMGTALKEGQGVDYVFGNRLVRFCCGACVKEFKKNPAKYLNVLDDASPVAGEASPTVGEAAPEAGGTQPPPGE